MSDDVRRPLLADDMRNLTSGDENVAAVRTNDAGVVVPAPVVEEKGISVRSNDVEVHMPDSETDALLQAVENESEEPEAGGIPVMRPQRTDEFHICMSGGGIRSAFFQIGALEYMVNKTANDEPILHRVKSVSSVSGGSYVACGWLSYLNLHPGQIVESARAFIDHAKEYDNPGFHKNVALIGMIALLLLMFIGNSVLVVYIAFGLLSRAAGKLTVDPTLLFQTAPCNAAPFDFRQLFAVWRLKDEDRWDWVTCYTPNNWVIAAMGIVAVPLPVLASLAYVLWSFGLQPLLCNLNCCGGVGCWLHNAPNRPSFMVKICSAVVRIVRKMITLLTSAFVGAYVLFLIHVLQAHYGVLRMFEMQLAAAVGLVSFLIQAANYMGLLPRFMLKRAVQIVLDVFIVIFLMSVAATMLDVINDEHDMSYHTKWVLGYYVAIVLLERFLMQLSSNYYSKLVANMFFAPTPARPCCCSCLSGDCAAFTDLANDCGDMTFLVNGSVQTEDANRILQMSPHSTTLIGDERDFFQKTCRGHPLDMSLEHVMGVSGAAIAVNFGNMSIGDSSFVRLFLWVLGLGLGRWIPFRRTAWPGRNIPCIRSLWRKVVHVFTAMIDCYLFWLFLIKYNERGDYSGEVYGTYLFTFYVVLGELIYPFLADSNAQNGNAGFFGCVGGVVDWVLRLFIESAQSLFFWRQISLVLRLLSPRHIYRAYATDGGHVENLGLVSMLFHLKNRPGTPAGNRRIDEKVKEPGRDYILTFDGGSCPLKCGCLRKALDMSVDLGIAQSYQLIDPLFSVQVEGNAYHKVVKSVGFTPQEVDTINRERIARVHVVLDEFRTVTVLYGKLAVLGPEYDRNLGLYTTETEFPHDTTLNQMLDYAETTHYRALGSDVAKSMFHRYRRGIP